MDITKVTRLEVIDHRAESPTHGRALVAYGVNVMLDLQDDDRTLKVFVTDGEPFEPDMAEWDAFMARHINGKWNTDT